MAHERETPSPKLPLGAALPTFSLPSTDGRSYGTEYLRGAKAALVAFTCNHCPYVKGSELALIELVKKFEAQGLKAVTISSNDAKNYPEDNFEKMKEKSTQLGLPYPYLYDESQAVAKLFDAVCTPEFFLFDSAAKLAYHGTINDSPRDPTKVTKHFLGAAIEQLLAGKPAEPSYVKPLGCSIKWKSAA